MNRFRLFATGTMLLVAFTAYSQQTDNGVSGPHEHGQAVTQSSAAEAYQHMKMLSERLNLSADQQAKIRPIVEHMLTERQKIMQDTSLSNEAREQKEKALHDKASRQARKYLNGDQKKELDELEQPQHS